MCWRSATAKRAGYTRFLQGVPSRRGSTLEKLSGVAIPTLVIPVRPATSMATLVEVAGRDELQRLAGNNAAKRLDEKLKTDAEHP